MLSENRLERRTLGERDDQVTRDYQDTNDDSAIYNTIKVGLVALGGYGLYKSGALKEIAKPLMEFADTVAKDGTDKASVVMSSVKQWTNLKNLSAEQLSRSMNQTHPIPKNSIFRERDTSLMYDLFSDLKNFKSSSRPTSNFTQLRKIMRDTQEDMHLLAEMIKENEAGLAALQTDYTKTELYSRLREVRRASDILKHNQTGRGQSDTINAKIMDEFTDLFSLNPDKAKQQMRESGYRTLTLNDILEKVEENNRTFLRVKKDSPIDLDSRANQKYSSLLDNINKTLNNPEFRTSDGVSLLDSDKWKDLIIDNNMRIGEKGKVIDFRMTKNNTIAFAHSLANDFKLPVVQFNPFKVFGLDKVGRYKPFVGMVSPDQFDANITKLGGRTSIGEWMSKEFGENFANKPIAIINGNAFVTQADALGNETGLKQIASGLKLHDITKADSAYGLKPLLNATRQMAGYSMGELPARTSEEFEQFLLGKGINPNKARMFKNQMFNALDIGHAEIHPDGSSGMNSIWGLDEVTSIDEFYNKIIDTVSGKVVGATKEEEAIARQFNLKSIFGKGFDDFKVGSLEIKPQMFTTTKEGYKVSSAMKLFQEGNKDAAREELTGFFGQYFSGRNADNTMGKYFTERTGVTWTVFNQLSQGLGKLGLGIESKRSVGAITSNLILKRALPVFAALQIPGMVNYFSEPFLGDDENGNPDNLGKWMTRNVAIPLDLKAHGVLDFTGASKVFKFLGEMTPGSDQIKEMPGIKLVGAFNPAQSEEERKDYIENGYEPIRKGRYWGSGNTPWSGGKIEYWRPNLYRRIQADVDFSGSKWGSRQEYYNNAWFPNPVNPLAPLNHFVFDKNHYDKKHYLDRPYLMTSPEGSNIPIVGPLFSSTIGQVLNPPKKMHMEYWQNGLNINPADEAKSTLLTEGAIFQQRPALQRFTPKNDVHTFNAMEQQIAKANVEYQNNITQSAYQAKQLISKGFVKNSGIEFETRNILPERTYDRYDNPYEVYSTPSGNLTVVDIPDDRNLYNVNQDLKRWSVNKVLGTKQRINPQDITIDMIGPDVPIGNNSPQVDNAFMYGLGEQYNWLGEVAGLKGFALQQFVTGHGNENATQIENSSYAYSVNNDFWEENLGGLGGNLSEITRRFIPKRNNNTEYINPIRNTMPSWMPGSSYFTDFKHGDPYSKIPNGEERLPGEGYERLHGMSNLMEFNIGSSSIGYDKAYIVRHMLKQDVVDTGFEEDTLATGTRIHNELEKQWMESGFAFSTEGEIQDKRNGIIGYYDAMVHDQSSRTGVGIIDIKTTSAKKLEELRKSGKPLEHHQKQVNYYLWATGNEKSKGYIHYVDKEDLSNTYTVGFNFDKGLLKDTLNNVYGARAEIRNAVDKGIIGRGELYKPLDQFRILADVAPYSQEYKDASARLSMENLSKDEQEEASQIRDRVTAQKEPLRVYDYKFKTANLKSETVTVQQVLDNNTIVTKEYGKTHGIKFAGINVSESSSELYTSHEETYTDKAGRKRKRTVGTSMKDAAEKEIHRYIKPGQKITISYDVDEKNKYSKDSTRSIRAVVSSHGKNVNNLLLQKGLAKEKENDDSPASINARYNKSEIAFGSAMETLTHKVVGNIPFVGSKMLQVRSPYEQYRKREVYSKDFQSWNHPIRDILIPNIQENIANNGAIGIGGIVMGGFIGSMFGKRTFGKLVGATVGATTTAIGKLIFTAGSDSKQDWRPKRRKEQEKLNEYVDILKYVKNQKLYEQYKVKALKEDNFDVERFMKSKESKGIENKLRSQELTNYKKKVKLDFKHRGNYNFNYGEPKYADKKMSKKDTISAINKELAEIQGDRKVTKLPANALKAIQYKQAAEKTMYGYDPGESLVNIMSSLPKKERQYFKHFMDAPEEEKEKILRIAPSYLRRALQSSWGMKVDQKPSLQEYFQTHALPDANWVGWNENTNMDDVKVKLVHQNKLDPGEFDIWGDNKKQADMTNIPIPRINARNSARQTQMRLQQILGKSGYDNVQVDFVRNNTGNKTVINTKQDTREDVSQQISQLEI